MYNKVYEHSGYSISTSEVTKALCFWVIKLFQNLPVTFFLPVIWFSVDFPVTAYFLFHF